MSILQNIKDYVSIKFNQVRYSIRKNYRWTIKSIQYGRFLREDEDWDYAHIMRLLQYKLQRTRKCITSNNFLMKSAINEKNRQIKYAESLIDRILADEYAYRDARYKALIKKWGEAKLFDHSIPGVGNFRNSKVKTKKQHDQSSKEFGAVYSRATLTRENELAALFEHLRKYIQCWWDVWILAILTTATTTGFLIC